MVISLLPLHEQALGCVLCRSLLSVPPDKNEYACMEIKVKKKQTHSGLI